MRLKNEHIQILRIVLKHETLNPSIVIKSSEIARSIGRTTQEIDHILESLEHRGYVHLAKEGPNNFGVWLDPFGEKVAREGSRPENSVTHYNIGAIIQSLSGQNVQATAIAHNAEISQIVNDPEALRTQIQYLTNKLIDAVRSELNKGELGDYLAAIEELQNQLLTERHDQSAIKRILKTLAFFGDIEGTLGLMGRVWPYISSLLLIAAQTVDALRG